MPALGPNFFDDYIAAGLTGLPFTWDANGVIQGRERLTEAENTALDAVIAAHVADSWP